MKTIILMTALMTFVTSGLYAIDRTQFEWGAFERVAIQERGRMKPFHTFAGETVLFVTGTKNFENKTSVEVMLSWMLEFEDQWEGKKFVRINYGPLKEKLGLNVTDKYFSPQELRTNERLRTISREIGQKSQRREKLNDFENKVVTLQNQVGVLNAIVGGQIIAILPHPQSMESPWFGIDALNDPGRLPYTGPQKTKTESLFKLVFGSFLKGDAPTWNANVDKIGPLLREDLSRGNYPVASDLNREVYFNQLRPFRLSWIFYTVAFVILLIFLSTNAKWAERLGFGTLMFGLLLHTYGFVIRCWISGRPPVTNMYESVIWVAWGCLVFSIIIGVVYRNTVVPVAATVFSILSLVLADNLPTVLDPGIQPLEPVLRSNFWLTTHVLCITLSYAAFALSLCVGNVVIGYFLFRPKETSTIQTLSLYMYRAMQIGVILVAGGTILGGVWADYSWGRFWGWDPKEVWALIVLLMYVAVLHGRFAGWLKGFGFVVSTILCFLSVLMAWYGVNFVLGVGLHSYGFGSGGLSYVMVYVLIQVGFVVAAWIRFKKEGGTSQGIFPK